MQIMEGMNFWKTSDGISVLRVHYTADPAKRDPDWIKEARMGTTQSDWQMEMEIDFTTVDGTPWYPEFNPALHVSPSPLQVNPNKPVIVGIDYGLTPATVFLQTTPKGEIMILYPELQSWDSGILKHGNLIQQAVAEYFPRNEISYYGDPAGNQRTQTDERTCVQLLREEYGINVFNGPVVFNQRDLPIRKALTTLVDGKAQLRIDPRCSHLIEALKGGYRRKQVNDVVKDEVDDNKYTHIIDAMGYAVSMIGYQGKKSLKKLPKLGEM